MSFFLHLMWKKTRRSILGSDCMTLISMPLTALSMLADCSLNALIALRLLSDLERWRLTALDKLEPDGRTDARTKIVTPWAPVGAKNQCCWPASPGPGPWWWWPRYPGRCRPWRWTGRPGRRRGGSSLQTRGTSCSLEMVHRRITISDGKLTLQQKCFVKFPFCVLCQQG